MLGEKLINTNEITQLLIFKVYETCSYPNRTTTIETLPDGRESIHVIVQPVDVPAYPSRQVK